MKLYIAEKPSLGRALADVLPRPHTKEEGCIRLGNGDYVSWCIGHLLEQAPPDAYDPQYKQWKLEHLPISPSEWKLEPKAKTKKQLSVLRKLLKKATTIVHAGDPDREGQLLVDEVINFIGITRNKRESIQRCLISDLNPTAVKKALTKLRPNREFIPLSTSALARARADWIYGMNMTRVCSIQGQKTGYSGVLSVGRVQTPLLGLVVKRDKEIERFQAKPYYQVWAHLNTLQGEYFKAKWQPSEACLPYQDEEGRVVSQSLADNVVSRIEGKTGDVTEVSKTKKKQNSPLPYSLSALQIDAAKRFGLKAKDVLDICQRLYETHKLITYPRSDCRYLPEDQFNDAQGVVSAIGQNSSLFSISELSISVVKNASLNLRSKAWNDKKITAHHAIIPTVKTGNAKGISSEEKNIYQLICRQYLAQFYPPWQFQDHQISMDIEGGSFVAKARQTIDLGWKVLFPKKREPASTAENSDEDDEIQSALPDLKKGDIVNCINAERKDKLTQAPKYFTDASLLAAMTGISRFVTDPSTRRILKDTDGLGTEATRAGIIELLFKREFLVRQGKQIRSTDTGKKLINALPESATTPDMTAEWESQLNAMSNKEMPYEKFMHALNDALPSLINQVSADAFRGLKSNFPKIKPYKRRVKKTNKSVAANH